jgi:hypothetical protein
MRRRRGRRALALRVKSTPMKQEQKKQKSGKVTIGLDLALGGTGFVCWGRPKTNSSSSQNIPT